MDRLHASPEYLAKHGEPESPADLELHSFIAFTGLMPSREWRFVDGATRGRVAVQPRLEINDGTAAIDAAEAGDGITLAASYMVAERIAEGRLKPVLGRYASPAVPVQLVYPQSRLLAPKVRAFVDFAGPRLKDVLRRLPAIPALAPGKGTAAPGAGPGAGRGRSSGRRRAAPRRGGGE